jgi:hypothetical protein
MLNLAYLTKLIRDTANKYGHVLPKLVIMTPWHTFCVDLIDPYTLKGKGGSSIDFICLTMINPSTSWFEIVELPTVTKATVPTNGKDNKVNFDNYTEGSETTFDKSSAQISNLVYKARFMRYLCCQCLIYDNRSELKLHFNALCNTYGIKRKPTIVKNPQANGILDHIHGVFTNMLRTAELNKAELVKASDIDVFLSNAAWLYLP